MVLFGGPGLASGLVDRVMENNVKHIAASCSESKHYTHYGLRRIGCTDHTCHCWPENKGKVSKKGPVRV